MKNKRKIIEVIVYIFTIIFVISLIYFFILDKEEKTIVTDDGRTLTVKEMLEYYDIEEIKAQGLLDEYDIEALTDEELLFLLMHGHIH